jgi:hypothetical protein
MENIRGEVLSTQDLVCCDDWHGVYRYMYIQIVQYVLVPGVWITELRFTLTTGNLF